MQTRKSTSICLIFNINITWFLYQTTELIKPAQYSYNLSESVLQIDQSVFTVCPAKPDVRPGMVLVFELFILRGSVTPTDRVVGWGCFPICDGEFNIVEGR